MSRRYLCRISSSVGWLHSCLLLYNVCSGGASQMQVWVVRKGGWEAGFRRGGVCGEKCGRMMSMMLTNVDGVDGFEKRRAAGEAESGWKTKADESHRRLISSASSCSFFLFSRLAILLPHSQHSPLPNCLSPSSTLSPRPTAPTRKSVPFTCPSNQLTTTTSSSSSSSDTLSYSTLHPHPSSDSPHSSQSQ